jgi:hypothetical protein
MWSTRCWKSCQLRPKRHWRSKRGRSLFAYFLSARFVCRFQIGPAADRASPPRTCDIPRPILPHVEALNRVGLRSWRPRRRRRAGCRRRESRAGFRFYQSDVSAVDETVSINILAEISGGHRSSRLRFGLSDIRRIDEMDLRLDILKAKN